MAIKARMVAFEVTSQGYSEPTFAVSVQVYDDVTNRPSDATVLEYPLDGFIAAFPTTAERRARVRDDMLAWASQVKINAAATVEFGPFLNVPFDIP